MTMMKKRHILHWAMGVLLTPLLGSCTSDDVVGGAGREECDIISGQPMTVTSATRATDGSKSSTQFEQDEIVWLWAKKSDGSEYINAWQLKADGNGGFSSATTGADKYWPSDGSKLNVYALHGNFTESDLNKNWSELTSLKHKVLTDQSFDDNRRQSDLLLAEKTNVTHGTTVDLSFEHLLAKITVKLDLLHSTGITNSDFATNAKVELLSILQEAYFVSSSITAPTSGGASIDINAGTITQPDNLSSDSYLAGSAIVPIQTFAANKELIQITLGSRTFKYKVESEITLEKGKEYTYTLQIRGEYVKGSLSVSDFTTSTVNQKFKDYFDNTGELNVRDYLGSSSAPHDLSYDYKGSMNTANCYVVTHPGYYKFPLVYGNAIKNGATNDKAYGVGTSSTTFVNHLDKKITDPYIYNNNGCTVGSADLVWQDAQYLVTNIELCDDKKYIKFEVKRSRIEQGNAVIAVKDGSGNIMWSWHIWVTNKNVYSTIPINTVALIYTTPNTSQKTYNFMPVPLGWDDDDPNHPNCPYYQWGRKDPFCPSDGTTDNKDKTMYDISGNNVYLKIEQGPVTTSTAIRNPIIYYYNGDHSTNYDWNRTTYFDYWNATNGNTISVNDNEVVKTVYDPNPVGFKMPSPDAFSGFTQDGYNQYDKSKWNVKDTSMPNNGFEFYTQGWNNDPTSYWHANGFRALHDGLLRNVGSWGIYWSSGPYDQTSGRYLYFKSSEVFPQSYSMDRATGFSVRPVSE